MILLAEDDPQVREHVARLLEGWGHTVTACADGEEAVESFLEHPDRFDLAVLDVIMPGLHGGEVFRRLRGQRPTCPPCS